MREFLHDKHESVVSVRHAILKSNVNVGNTCYVPGWYFTIIHKNTNVDFFFDLHKETKSSEQVGEISEELINIIDKFIKKNPTTSDGDLFQALALLIATRVYISPFDNEKILDMLFKMAKDGISNIDSGKISRIGNS